MKITIYTITDCQFSKQEKEYLSSHQLQFEERNLEQNKDWLTEMLAISNNFAGTPVTKIEKDDGQIVVLKGFTQEEFDEVLGFASSKSEGKSQPTQAAPKQTAPPAQPTQIPTPQPQAPPTSAQPQQPVEPVMQPPVTPPVAEPTMPVNQPMQQNPVPQEPMQNDPMSSILNNLKEKSGNDQPASQNGMPNIPNPDFS